MKTIIGISRDKVKEISALKGEPKWMTDFRLKSYDKFESFDNPNFGPPINIDFDSITYYKKVSELKDNWNDLDVNLKDTFEELGVIDAEEKYLDGIGAQYESSVIYHNMIKELDDLGVIFCDTDTALKKHPELFKKYFNNLVKYDENKYTALNGAVWSGGTFIYIPPHTKVKRPLQSYFRIQSELMGQFERTIIIVDEYSEVNYMEGCTAPTYTSSSLHAAVVEIYVANNAKCRYTTIQNWANNVINLVTKRSVVGSHGLMEWIDGNIGSRTNMKYPSCILKGEYAKGNTVTIAFSGEGQVQDTGAKMIHLAPFTESSVISKSVALNGGNASYRGTTYIDELAVNSKSFIKCDTLILDDLSKSDTIPTNIIKNNSSIIDHEAVVSKISREKLGYLMSRGITEDRAEQLLIMGFIDQFRKELPMEYAVELNQLLKEYF